MASSWTKQLLVDSQDFRGRCVQASMKQAQYVYDTEFETAEGGSVKAQKRVTFAQQVLAMPSMMSDRFAYTSVQNTELADQGLDAPDSQYEYVAGTSWDAWSGAFPEMSDAED